MGRQRKQVVSGCEFWDDCDTCPLPKCVEEMPRVARPALRRKLKAWKLIKEGYTIEQIADKLGMSTRTIQRYVEEFNGSG